MFCNKCGTPSEGTSYCPNCGAEMQSIEYAVTQTAMPRPRSKRRIWAVVGIAAGAVVVAAAALFFLLTSAVDGVWYNKDRGEVLTFRGDGTIELASLGNTDNADFIYDRFSGKGSFKQGSQLYEFTAKDKQINVGGLGVYKKAGGGFDTDGFLNEYGYLGTWYSEERGEVLAFNADGEMQRTRLSGTFDATYEYDNDGGKLSLGSTSYDFTVDDSQMNIDGLGVYIKAEGDFDAGGFLGKYGYLGTWCSEERGEVLVFNLNSKLQSKHTIDTNDASYNYYPESETGVITIDPFSYEFRLDNEQLNIEGMGIFTEADDSFDENAFFDKFGDSPLGIWYDTSGKGVIDLHTDGTYDLITYGRSQKGTYERDNNDVTIIYKYIDLDIDVAYSCAQGALKSVEDQKGAGISRYTRDYSEQKGKVEMFENVLGRWISEDGDVALEFYNDGTGTIDFPDIHDNAVYQYDPLGNMGYFTVVEGRNVLFVAYDDYLSMSDVSFYRVD